MLQRTKLNPMPSNRESSWQEVPAEVHSSKFRNLLIFSRFSCALRRSTHGLLLLKVHQQFRHIASFWVRRKRKVHLCKIPIVIVIFTAWNSVKSHEGSDPRLWETRRVLFKSVKRLISIRWGSDLNSFQLWFSSLSAVLSHPIAAVSKMS